jgi:hypothetical protein
MALFACGSMVRKREDSTWKRFFTPIAQRKMMSAGIESLTDVELLALFLRTGTRGNQ